MRNGKKQLWVSQETHRLLKRRARATNQKLGMMADKALAEWVRDQNQKMSRT